MKNILIISLLFILIVSCKKDENPTKTELLTGSPWILTSSVYNPPIQGTSGYFSDVYDLIYPCKTDDLWELNEGGTFAYNEGKTDCESLAPGSWNPDVWEMGFWALSQDENKLFVYSLLTYFSYIEYDILNLTSSELQIRYDNYLDNDSVLDSLHVVTDTYIHPN